MDEIKKERTIRSETTKVFLIIFSILVIVGAFTIGSSIIGSNNFTNIRQIHLKQFRAAEIMKARALDVIAIYYLLATDQDQEVLMRELKRYDGLVENFESARNTVISSYKNAPEKEKDKVLKHLQEIKVIFDDLNNTCRRMTFAMMAGDKKGSAAEFPNIDSGIRKFKASLDAVEAVVEKQLDKEADEAQGVFKHTTNLGIAIIILAMFITLGLIYYLMKFLSISLLPISNLMHNMRQAVFSIDKNQNVISPVSAYSSVVFGENIVGKSINDIAYSEVDKASEAFSKNKMALDVVFGADDLQWMLQEDGLMRQVTRTIPGNNGSNKRILKLTYTPLMQKELVENIMIVAEDVTEVEALRAESFEKQRELEIIKTIVDMNRQDLESFLSDVESELIKCHELILNLSADQESRKLLFRILHTIKGNARMYQLNAISEVVHVAESTVVEINNMLEVGDEFNKERIECLKENLINVEKCLTMHKLMSSKFSTTKTTEQSEGMIELPEVTYNEIKSIAASLVNESENEKLIVRLNQTIENAFKHPIQSVCKKMEPMVYELSKSMGKDIQFILTGDNIAVDRQTANSIRDALVHIVRNSLDHGIETPEERIKKGKNDTALLHIDIQQKEQIIEIAVKDDGRGIDDELLVKKALSLGKINETELSKLSREDRLNLIFIPNLSTKDNVTDLSGRGVGMDAVKNTIHTLGGNIKVSSASDVGTEFIVHLKAV